jgi:hypothetical protein
MQVEPGICHYVLCDFTETAPTMLAVPFVDRGTESERLREPAHRGERSTAKRRLFGSQHAEPAV